MYNSLCPLFLVSECLTNSFYYVDDNHNLKAGAVPRFAWVGSSENRILLPLLHEIGDFHCLLCLVETSSFFSARRLRRREKRENQGSPLKPRQGPRPCTPLTRKGEIRGHP